MFMQSDLSTPPVFISVPVSAFGSGFYTWDNLPETLFTPLCLPNIICMYLPSISKNFFQYLYYELGIVRSNIDSVKCQLFVAFTNFLVLNVDLQQLLESHPC